MKILVVIFCSSLICIATSKESLNCKNYLISGEVINFPPKNNAEYNYEAIVRKGTFNQEKIKLIGKFNDDSIEHGKVFFRIKAEKINSDTYRIIKIFKPNDSEIKKYEKGGFLETDC